jgi:hypothetical protein
MSRLHIVIGFDSAKSDAVPSLVYLGRSGEQMRTAIEASPAPRHLILNNPVGITKNNSRAADNAARIAAANTTAHEQRMKAHTATVEAQQAAAKELADAKARIAELEKQRAPQADSLAPVPSDSPASPRAKK